jgi:hypothetical protein
MDNKTNIFSLLAVATFTDSACPSRFLETVGFLFFLANQLVHGLAVAMATV